MTAKTINYCRKIISGEIKTICGQNIEQNWVIMNAAHTALHALAPDDSLVARIKEERSKTDDNAKAVFRHLLQNGRFGLNMSDPYAFSEKPENVTWLIGLDDLKGYAVFGEVISERIAPFLYEICERLINPSDPIQITVNRYWGTVGQYSESWRNNENKKKDLLLRYLRILNYCE
jgi:hypothetical protein